MIDGTVLSMNLAKVTGQVSCDCGSTEFEIGLHTERGANEIVLLQCAKCKKQTLTRAVGDSMRRNLA